MWRDGVDEASCLRSHCADDRAKMQVMIPRSIEKESGEEG